MGTDFASKPKPPTKEQRLRALRPDLRCISEAPRSPAESDTWETLSPQEKTAFEENWYAEEAKRWYKAIDRRGNFVLVKNPACRIWHRRPGEVGTVEQLPVQSLTDDTSRSKPRHTPEQLNI